MNQKNTSELELKLTILISFFLSLTLFVLILFIGSVNRQFLEGEPRIIKIKNGSDFLLHLADLGIKGRELLILDTTLYSEMPPFAPSFEPMQNIINLRTVFDPAQIEPNDQNFVYLSLLKGQIKAVHLILPQKDWFEKKNEFWGPFLRLKNGSIVGAFYEGTPYTISSEKKPHLPKERPVLFVNPDLFSDWGKIARLVDPDLILIWGNNEENRP